MGPDGSLSSFSSGVKDVTVVVRICVETGRGYLRARVWTRMVGVDSTSEYTCVVGVGIRR